MTTIPLDPTLKPIDPGTLSRTSNALDAKRMVQGLKWRAKIDDLPWVRGELKGRVFHANYLDYLEFCYGAHYTPVISPDILWFGLLNEMASLIREDPEAVRQLFSSKPDKVRITVITDDPEVIPLDAIVAQLKHLVPSGTDTYLPTFSTTVPSARFAHYAAFCDAVSPYYDYCMKLCGFPAVRIDGTVNDYVKLSESWRAIPDLLKRQSPVWWAQVQTILDSLIVHIKGATDDDPQCRDASTKWFKTLFTAKRCGSGSDTEVTGWITQLYRKQPKRPAYASNYEPHIAKVEYKALDSGREFTMLYGLFSSEVTDDAVVVPSFSPLVFERGLKAMVEPDPRDKWDSATLAAHALQSRHLASQPKPTPFNVNPS